MLRFGQTSWEREWQSLADASYQTSYAPYRGYYLHPQGKEGCRRSKHVCCATATRALRWRRAKADGGALRSCLPAGCIGPLLLPSGGWLLMRWRLMQALRPDTEPSGGDVCSMTQLGALCRQARPPKSRLAWSTVATSHGRQQRNFVRSTQGSLRRECPALPYERAQQASSPQVRLWQTITQTDLPHAGPYLHLPFLRLCRGQ